MNTTSEPLGLRSPDGREAQLLSAQVQGEVLGLMLRLTVRQTWRNTSGAPMATRLTFGLTPEQCLLDLQVQRPGNAQNLGAVSRLSPEACSAGFGIMHTGEQVTLQWRIGQLLQLQGGSLRLRLPATVAPPALRPARLSIEIHDPAAHGTLGSTSHDMQRVRHANGMTLQLQAPHGLDKDLAVNLHGLRDTGFAVASPDLSRPGHCTVLTSHSLRMDKPPAQRLRLKVLIDSMDAVGSERRVQIHTALDRLMAQLQASDQLSLSHLGTALVHDLPRLQPCNEAYLRRARVLVRHNQGVSDEPDWCAVLQEIIAIRDEDEEPVQDASILLITTRPLEDMSGPLQPLRAAGHRLHVMAIGDAASHGHWPRLALASDGSSETLGPGQHSQQTLSRLIERMRSLHPVQAGLSVQGQALDPARHEHRHMADGDTLHLWASMQSAQTPADLTGCPQWRAQMQWHAPDEASPVHMVGQLPVLWDAAGDLARLCASRELPIMHTEVEREELVRQHRLLLPAQPRLARPTGAAPATPPQHSEIVAQAGADRTGAVPASQSVPSPTVTTLPLRTPAERPTPASTLAALVQQFNQQAPAYRHFRAALSASLQRVSTRPVDALVMRLARQAGNPGRVWAMLLHWLHVEQELPLQAQALQLVEHELASTPVALRQQIHAALVHNAWAPASRKAA